VMILMAILCEDIVLLQSQNVFSAGVMAETDLQSEDSCRVDGLKAPESKTQIASTG
jgi:hypothetical protein